MNFCKYCRPIGYILMAASSVAINLGHPEISQVLLAIGAAMGVSSSERK